MDKAVQITLIIVLGIVVLATIGYTAFSSLIPLSNTVTGNGEAIVEVIPDLVKVYFNVETEGDTSQEAKDANAEIVDELIVALVREGFERKDIQTQNFNIYPEYDWRNGNRELYGYRATHSIVVKMSTDESNKIGEAIDTGVDAGAGISYINFELSQEKENEYKAEAIELAAQDARIKAESLAAGLGKELGKLISVSDSNFGYRPWQVYGAVSGAEDMAVAKEATTEIQPGEQQISARVTAIFKLK
ncbi:MAG: SIMPL domain-containing protein [Nanoarchaeota archaeon]|nr:SIMPL domain-containing protein [Nanoarchaeota archaeon]MBU1027764.1 SIMPL domain-containing protein [Nanoarchaeota archaeon]